MVALMQHILAALAVLGVWCTFTYFFPRKRCRKCSGWGSKAKARRRRACGRCGATGRTMRLSAVLTHRAAHAIRVQVREFIKQRREVSS